MILTSISSLKKYKHSENTEMGNSMDKSMEDLAFYEPNKLKFQESNKLSILAIDS